MKRHAPAALRNQRPILDVLARALKTPATVLEIASGSGEHAVFFAAQLPAVTWQPSDADDAARASVESFRADANLPNLLAPLAIDTRSDVKTWGIARADAVVCINMIHIAPWECCEGLLRGAAALLPAGGVLFLYGPFKQDGQHTAPSNAEFDASLRARDASWGVRDLDGVTREAADRGLTRVEIVAMPANNLSVVFVKGKLGDVSP